MTSKKVFFCSQVSRFLSFFFGLQVKTSNFFFWFYSNHLKKTRLPGVYVIPSYDDPLGKLISMSPSAAKKILNQRLVP